MIASRMTTEKLHHGDITAVIDLALPDDAGPRLLGEARGYCMSLIERLEFVHQYPVVSRGEDGEEFDEESPWHELARGAADKMRRAQSRLSEIDRALCALGYEPEQCSYGQPLLH
jgi:hypothetical protein